MEAIELYLDAPDIVPAPRGLRQHIADGSFNDKDIAEEYIVAQTKVFSSKIAA